MKAETYWTIIYTVTSGRYWRYGVQYTAIVPARTRRAALASLGASLAEVGDAVGDVLAIHGRRVKAEA